MATYMKDCFGESLLTDYIDDDANPSSLPTLEVCTFFLVINQHPYLFMTAIPIFPF